MHVYPMKDYHDHSYCMQHCEKFGGHSPSVRTFDEWQSFLEEVKHIEVDPLRLPRTLWLSATEGDKKFNLNRLDHWPKGIEAVEGVWRDYSTGKELDNYTKPWLTDKRDSKEGTISNCINYFPSNSAGKSWQEWLFSARYGLSL